MARKSPSRLDKRREHEAAEARDTDGATTKKAAGKKTARKKATRKKATATRARRTKAKAAVRKRVIWVVFNGSMKEEARFPYDQRAAAEAKLKALQARATKKLYFIQPMKEEIPAGEIVVEEVEAESSK